MRALGLSAAAVTAVTTAGIDAAVAHPEHCGAPPPLDPVGPRLVLDSVARTLFSPTHVAAPPGDSRRLVATERTGQLRLIRDGRVLQRPFLDLSPQIAPTIDAVLNERGLFSIAFAPDYSRSRRFYLFFSDAEGDARVREYRRSSNPDVALAGGRDLFVLEHSFAKQHYGGHLAFGPDGLLYASFGDAMIPPLAQRPRQAYGKIVGLDTRHPRRAPRFLATGLRNPYRFSFDRLSGDLIASDVGEARWEEINVLSPNYRGIANFGWPRYEGHDRSPGTQPLQDHKPPRVALSHPDAHAIVGGFVVRDRSLPSLYGRYVFGDTCDGTISSVQLRRRGAVPRLSGLVVPSLASFSEGPRGQLYVTSLAGGIYRLTDR